MPVTVSGVQDHSPAKRAGIQPESKIISINGNEINDVLDYQFYISDSKLLIELETPDGERNTVEIRKKEYDDLGLEFDCYLMDEQHCCKNKCIFCFIDQMPPNMRETLYFKDDDSRLGFLFGNYITMTNLEDKDIDRIIKMHLSPINVSVHTTNPELRVQMMKNPKAADSLKYLRKLADAGIVLHIQIVLCPGINDGSELERTFKDIVCLGNSVESAVCVPVGLTKYRDNLPKLVPFDKKTSKDVIDLVDNYREKMMAERGYPLFYAADEFYVKCDLDFPDYEYYGEFTQLEDGVGLCTLLEHDFMDAIGQNEGECHRNITIPTGKAAYRTIKKLADVAQSHYTGLRINVVAIDNNFFGEKITVTGLLTGGDITSQLGNMQNEDAVLICESTLRYGNDRFIDDMTPNEISDLLNTKVIFVPNDGYALMDAILGENDG